MPIFQDTYFGERDMPWPKFLSRDEESDPAVTPPPLPHGPLLARLRRIWIEMPRHRAVGAGAAALTCSAIAAAFALGGATDPGVVAVRQTPFEVAKVESTDDTREEPKAQARLSETEAQRDQDAATEDVSGDPAAWQVQTVAAADTFDDTEALSLIVLRGLPEGVTFAEGVPSGKGEWAMAAADGDIDQLAAKLGEGLEKPLTADVEMISRAGLQLGTLRLELRKSSGGTVAQALAAEAGEGVAAMPDPQAPEQNQARPNQVEQPADAEQKEAEPTKRKQMAGARKKNVSVAEAGRKKRVSNSDRAPKGKIMPPVNAGEGGQEWDVAVKPEEESPGLLSKFFSFFSSNKKDDGEPTNEPTAPAHGLDPPPSALGYRQE